MLKKYLLLLFLLNSCTAPGSAFLGPVFTGATTQSLSRASLSYGTNQIIKKIHRTSKVINSETSKVVKRFHQTSDYTTFNKIFNFHN